MLEKRLFDARGSLISVQNGAGVALAGLTILDRGYTGHEHLQSVGLINMNGRLYDPKLHRFLQPDNYVQDPYNTQNYNRYGYVLNNPLKYTDPSGEEILLGTAILIGALIAATTYTMTALLADVPFTVGGFIQATFIGAMSGAVTFGIGTAASSIQQLGVRMVFQALAHGTFNGMMSGIQGGNFWSGFAAGSLSSLAAGLWQGGAMAGGDGQWSGLGGNFGNTDFGTIAFGTVSGGVGAKLTGGNFWQGAVTGLMVSALNEVAHKENNSETKKILRPKKVLKETWQRDVIGTITPNGSGISVTNTDSIEIWTDLVLVDKNASFDVKTTVLATESTSNTSYKVELLEYTYSKATFWSKLDSYLSSFGPIRYPSGSQNNSIYINWKGYNGANLFRYNFYLVKQ